MSLLVFSRRLLLKVLFGKGGSGKPDCLFLVWASVCLLLAVAIGFSVNGQGFLSFSSYFFDSTTTSSVLIVKTDQRESLVQPNVRSEQDFTSNSGLLERSTAQAEVIYDADPSFKASFIGEVEDPQLLELLDVESQFSTIYHISLDLISLSQSSEGQYFRIQLPDHQYVDLSVEENANIGGHQISFKEISGQQLFLVGTSRQMTSELNSPTRDNVQAMAVRPTQPSMPSFEQTYASKLLVSPDFGLVFGDVSTDLGRFRMETFRGEVYLMKFGGASQEEGPPLLKAHAIVSAVSP